MLPWRRSRLVRFAIALLLGLAMLTAAAYYGVTRTTRLWSERDLDLRSQLAVAAASQGLRGSWQRGNAGLRALLYDMTRDERIMGAAACTLDGVPLGQTAGYPRELGCRELLDRLSQGQDEDGNWSTTENLAGGPVHVSVSTLDNDDGPLGYIVLIHDTSFVARREATARNMLIGAFAILALGASLVTMLAARLAWEEWSIGLRRALLGEPAPEFRPLLRDVRALMSRRTLERRAEARTGGWTPERLHSTLTEQLQGERVVILANREPYLHQRTEGGIAVQHPASGLVTALEPVMRACSGVWVAHGSGTADRETVDRHGRVRVPPGEESYVLRRVWLTEDEENGYYYGFANEGLWPLCHLAHARPVFRSADWGHYVRVNQKFADAVYSEVDSDDPIVLVQDYHFAVAPRMIRERLPRATILTFWHIPWPDDERFGICPWREEILSGLLGSSIVGFHTRQHCSNFIDGVDAFMESRIDREDSAIVQGSRRTLVRPYPISIEWPVHWLRDLPPVADCRTTVRHDIGLSPRALLGLGIDRLDYTKGIEERLQAVDVLLERYPEFRGLLTFVQLAAPSRMKIDRYQELSERVERIAREINKRWGRPEYQPIVLQRVHHEPPTVFKYYRAADFCYVSSLHDGMNLVAKEFVAAREDEAGVLVLSQFTGAARDLTEALVVNPYDLRQSSDALATALRMPLAEQRARMRSMRKLVAEFNVYRWAGRMLVDAAEVRRRERLSGLLSRVSAEPVEQA
jgi:trehalose 6-phosphate synthase